MKTYRIITCIIFLILSTVNICSAQSLYINELMASNSSSISDPDSNFYSDWIELYNAGQEAVNLNGYYISDDPSFPGKYKIPAEVIIAPGGYTLIWADDMNTGVHTNFKLSPDSDGIYLYNSAFSLIDSISFTDQETDISFGRSPDGGISWYKFCPASPGSSNQSSDIYNKLSLPVFSLQGGFYNSPVSLFLTHEDADAVICYTTNGKEPSINDVYSGLISIDSTVAITVKAFKPGYISSDAIVYTYLINFQTTLPVFSIVTDPDNFFSDTSGIYVIGTNGITGNCSTEPRNWNQDWERPVNLEFFESDNDLAFSLRTGIKIHGGCSRIYPMKSLALYFRDMYGTDRLNYRLFSDFKVTSFNNFILRSSGQDWWRTMFRDGMVQTLIHQNMLPGGQAYRPSIVFINGQYWGIHNVGEMLNDWYLNSHYHADINNIDIVEISKGVFANNGDLTAYNSMIDFLSTHPMNNAENYSYIKSVADIDDYIDYQIAQIYTANGDWPGSNVKLWRERIPTGKFRWLIYDLDFTFGGNGQGQYYTNTLEQATATNGPSWPNPPWSTLMFRKLLENTEFKNEFIQRLAVHINTTFNPVHVNNVIDSIGGLIASEIPRHKARWAKSISMGSDWLVNVQLMRDFAILRPAEMRSHIYSKFNISGSYELTVSRNNPDWGKIYAHNIEIKNNAEQDTFFNNIPLKLTAMPMPGYRFVRWEGASADTFFQTQIVSSADSNIKAVFEPAPLNVMTAVINEINYNSSPSFDTGDWIELYNSSSKGIDLSGWKISDTDYAELFTFPAGAYLNANDYLILCRDTLNFNILNPEVNNVIGNFSFGLSAEGDKIILYDAAGICVDSLWYGVSGDWPALPNGNGPTLALVNPQYDNTQGLNWRASGLYGTPGRLNDTYSEIVNEVENNISDFRLYNNFPNPFNPETVINWQIPSACNISLRIYDVLGREIITLVDEYRQAGIYNDKFNAAGLPSGIYFYQLKTTDFVSTKKMVLVK